MDDQNKNLILATALSFLVILVWFLVFPPQVQEGVPTEEGTNTAAVDGTATPPASGSTPQVPGSLPATPAETRAEAVSRTERVALETPALTGSISLRGGRIDDLSLLEYRETIDDDSPIVTYLSPAGAPGAFYAVHGWAGAGGLSGDAVPGATTEWQREGEGALTPENPVRLTWDNGQGQIFTKTIAVDDHYMFTVSQTVQNTAETAVSMFPYGILARQGEPDQLNFFVLHEGLIGAADGELSTSEDYDDLRDFDIDPLERAPAQKTRISETGYIGFTDHYWMATLVAPNNTPATSVAKYTPGNDTYQTELRYNVVEIAPGATAETVSHFFAGAKEFAQLRDYQRDLEIGQFVDAIDWGWFSILTKPIFRALHFLNLTIGNMGLAILALTLLLKLLLFPLAYKSYVSMSKMKMLQPEMEKIKERAGDDRVKLQQEMMALYKKEKVNPASGCLPILVQIPIFFSLYKVIFVTIDLRHAPFFGWLQDLSAPDPSSVLNLFGLLPFTPPEPGSLFAIFSIGVLPILMGVTMWMQQKLNPAPPDKTQAMIIGWMPWVFMFMLGTFASGLVLYWTANNIITFIQQYTIMRSQGAKPDVFGNIIASFRRDKSTD
ncbi:membrane protein insertase YidC [Algicella marina]|uniref:Membrane protein insertase YidC n=1 Tax=Algicella marina TaxID=2683284 RepID=A0A6P1T1G5_9RHOB|nr:membrane protein insertase YidC [Algicella marina]QHQ35827.1 membrane protein insertase YidC [Algicella marina]